MNHSKLATQLTALEYAIIHGHYEPSKAELDYEFSKDRAANPYNDPHKPKLRTTTDVIIDLKKKYWQETLTKI